MSVLFHEPSDTKELCCDSIVLSRIEGYVKINRDILGFTYGSYILRSVLILFGDTVVYLEVGTSILSPTSHNYQSPLRMIPSLDLIKDISARK